MTVIEPPGDEGSYLALYERCIVMVNSVDSYVPEGLCVALDKIEAKIGSARAEALRDHARKALGHFDAHNAA